MICGGDAEKKIDSDDEERKPAAAADTDEAGAKDSAEEDEQPTPSEPSLRNPTPKFAVVDSSDEECSEDTELNLSNRSLTAIPDNIAKKHGERTRVLTLTNNRMRNFKSLSYFSSLDTLILDKNNLKTLDGIPAIPTLKTLWLNNNAIERIDTLLNDISKLFPKIEYLSLLKNPGVPALYFESGNEGPYTRLGER